jgi:hypothetical protein
MGFDIADGVGCWVQAAESGRRGVEHCAACSTGWWLKCIAVKGNAKTCLIVESFACRCDIICNLVPLRSCFMLLFGGFLVVNGDDIWCMRLVDPIVPYSSWRDWLIYIYYIPWYTNDISNVDQVGHIADISFVIRGCFTALDDLSVGHFTSNTAWLGLVGSQRLWVTTQHTRPCDSAAANGGRSFHIHLKGFQVVLQPGGYEMIFLRFSNHLTFVFTNL